MIDRKDMRDPRTKEEGSTEERIILNKISEKEEGKEEDPRKEKNNTGCKKQRKRVNRKEEDPDPEMDLKEEEDLAPKEDPSLEEEIRQEMFSQAIL